MSDVIPKVPETPEKRSSVLLRSTADSPHANEEFGAGDDSEAETERLHDSPLKRRLLEELDEPEPKKLKISTHQKGSGPSLAGEIAFPPSSAEPRLRRGPESAATAVRAEPASPQQPQPADSDENDDSGLTDERADATEAADEPQDLEAQGDEESGDASDDEDEDEKGDRERAIKALTEIEVEFAAVQDGLHDQRLAQCDLEILMCGEGVHPQLKEFHAHIINERDEQLQRSRGLLAYQINSIHREMHASRCQIFQTHFKEKLSLRTRMLGRVTSRWYEMNYERREANRVSPHYGYVASGRPHQIRRPTAESLGITKKFRVHGELELPAAPKMRPASSDERHEDLRQLGLR